MFVSGYRNNNLNYISKIEAAQSISYLARFQLAYKRFGIEVNYYDYGYNSKHL